MEGVQHASHMPSGGVHRSNRVLGGAEQVVDETGQRMKDEFLTFLETYCDWIGGRAGSNNSW